MLEKLTLTGLKFVAAVENNNTVNLSPLPNSKVGTKDAADAAWHSALNIVFGLAGVIAVMLIVINGLQYISANGDAQKIAQAKQGIMYSVIGLLIVILAFTIVTFALRGIS